jgi:hypothetical protein
VLAVFAGDATVEVLGADPQLLLALRAILLQIGTHGSASPGGRHRISGIGGIGDRRSLSSLA